MYSHDTSITYAVKDIKGIEDYCLNNDLKSVNTRLSSNRLKLNLNKTEYLIIITSRQRRANLSDSPSLTINDVPIHDTQKDGATRCILDRLTYQPQIYSVCMGI